MNRDSGENQSARIVEKASAVLTIPLDQHDLRNQLLLNGSTSKVSQIRRIWRRSAAHLAGPLNYEQRETRDVSLSVK